MTNALVLCDPSTEYRPKIPPHIIDINGKSVLERIIDGLADIDLNKICLYTSYMANELIGFCDAKFSKHSCFEKIKIFAVSSFAGSGGAVAYVDKKSKDSDDLLIVHANSISKISFVDLMNQTRSSEDPVLVVSRSEEAVGNITLDHDHKRVLSCTSGDGGSGYIYAGICWLPEQRAQYFVETPPYRLEEKVFPKLVHPNSYILQQPWFDLENTDNIKKAIAAFK